MEKKPFKKAKTKALTSISLGGHNTGISTENRHFFFGRCKRQLFEDLRILELVNSFTVILPKHAAVELRLIHSVINNSNLSRIETVGILLLPVREDNSEQNHKIKSEKKKTATQRSATDIVTITVSYTM